MAAQEEVLVADLMKMSAEELRSRTLIKLKDPENMTAEHSEKLRLLVNGLDESQGLDLGAVNERLQNLAGAAGPGLTRDPSLTPDFNDPVLREEERLENIHWEHVAYNDIIREGGRPSHRPDDSGFDYLDGPQIGIIQYWLSRCIANEEFLFRRQRTFWREFREHQDRRRRKYWKPEWFESFVREVREYRRKKGLEGDISLLQDREKQTMLQDWVELQYWEYRKADSLKKQINYYAREQKEREEKIRVAIDAGRSADDIARLREQYLGFWCGQRRGAEMDLESKLVLLEWIDEQVAIIASEGQTSLDSPQAPTDGQPARTSLGKRKRSASQSSQVQESGRKVRFAEASDKVLAPTENDESRGAGRASLPEGKALGTPSTITHQRDGQAAPDPGAAAGAVHVSEEDSEPARQRSSPRVGPRSSPRGETKASPAQVQNEQHSAAAAPSTSGLDAQPAAAPAAEDAAALEQPHAQLATSPAPDTGLSSPAPAPGNATPRRVRPSRVSKA